MSDEISRRRGDTKPIAFKFWADKSAGIPLDISLFSFILTVDPSKAPVDATNNLFSLVGEIYAEGSVRFLPTALQMDITPGTYFYDLQVTDAEGFIGTEKLDKFKVSQDITK